MARRLVERGVRFVQCWSGGTGGEGDWDGHKQCDKNHVEMAAKIDRPVAALLAGSEVAGLAGFHAGDLGRRVRPHTCLRRKYERARRCGRPRSQSLRLLNLDGGGGIKGVRRSAGTDEIGLRAIDYPVHVHDLHASILYLMGIDHTKLSLPVRRARVSA